MNTERVTPHDLDAEKALLGAALLDAEAAAIVVEGIRAPEMFFRQPHQSVYRAIHALVGERQPVDAVTVSAWLASRDTLESVGGKAYVMGLVDGVPRRTNVNGYLEAVRDCALRRKLLAAGQRVLRLAEDGERDAGAALDAAQAELFALTEESRRGELLPVESLVGETLGTIERLQESPGVTGLATGFSDLDALTRGLQRKNLVMIAARPSMGKTAMALNIAAHLGAAGKAVAFFSLEMSREELMLRLVSSVGQIDGHRMASGYLRPTEYSVVADAVARIGAWPLWIDDTANLSVLDILGRARRLAARKRLDCVIVDYLQLLISDRRYESRVLELGAISRALKGLAKDLAVPVVALSQLNRAAEARGDRRPQLSDLRDSGSLEQDADLVLLLYREEQYEPKPENAGVAEVIVGKQRNGPTGVVRLSWLKQFTRFENIAEVRS